MDRCNDVISCINMAGGEINFGNKANLLVLSGKKRNVMFLPLQVNPDNCLFFPWECDILAAINKRGGFYETGIYYPGYL